MQRSRRPSHENDFSLIFAEINFTMTHFINPWLFQTFSPKKFHSGFIAFLFTRHL